MNYSQVQQEAKELGSALKHLGLDKSTRFNIFASTSPHWLTMSFACVTQSITFCTSYDSLGVEGVRKIEPFSV